MYLLGYTPLEFKGNIAADLALGAAEFLPLVCFSVFFRPFEKVAPTLGFHFKFSFCFILLHSLFGAEFLHA